MAARTPSAWSTPSSSSGSSSGNFNWNPTGAWGSDSSASNFNWGTQDISTPVFDRVYTGGGIDTSNWNLDWGLKGSPEPNYGDYRASGSPSWLDIGKAALDAATRYRSTPGGYSSSPRRGQSVSSPGSEITDLGSGYKLVQRSPVTKQKTTAGSSGGGGIGGTIGQIVGLGAGLLLAPATGGASAALAAGSLGSGIGGSVGRTVEGFFG